MSGEKIRELVVVSGKGGTGKTTVSASLAALAQSPVMADCDVDASNLELLLSPTLNLREDFKGGSQAFMDKGKCVECGKCAEVCRFDAFNISDGEVILNQTDCEGCGTCAFVCPTGAIEMREVVGGEIFTSDTRFGPMVHARLKPGLGNSGKLATSVKTRARKIAAETGSKLIIVDGPPGVGCPAIASVTGATDVLAVTEPTLSGEHDLRRIIELCSHFKIPVTACVNKADLNIEMTERIERACLELGAKVGGRIPYDKTAIERAREGVPLIAKRSKAADAVAALWEKLKIL